MYKFSDQLNKDWQSIVNKVKAEKSKGNFGGIVLDLRNNPGGFLEASVMVASDFLKDGVVVTQQTADGGKQEYKVDTTKGQLVDDKMVVHPGGTGSQMPVSKPDLRLIPRKPGGK